MSDLSTDLNNLREDIKDELLAINHYQSHIDATDNPEIQKLHGHIRDEEKEHVAELVKLLGSWIRRRMRSFRKKGI